MVVWQVLSIFPSIQKLVKAVTTACVLVETLGNGEWKKEKVMELAMQLWEQLDPTPELDLDDSIVEAILEWLIDTIADAIEEQKYTKDTKVS